MVSWSIRFAGLALAVLSLEACSVQPRYPITPGGSVNDGGVVVAQPRYPITPPPPPPPPPAPRAPAADDDSALRAAPSAPIESQALPPPGAAGPTPAPNPAPAPQPPSEASLSERPPSALAAPSEVQVQPFENVYDVAERVRTPLRALIELNGLRPPYVLTPGMVLRVPPPVIYTVGEGDTLFGVARRFSIDPRSLANLNDFAMETRLRPGQTLALPSLVQDKGPNREARGPRPTGLEAQTRLAAGGEGRPGAGRPSAERPAVEPLPPRPSTPSASEAEIASLGRGKFIWPVHGEVLSTFGPKGPGQRNDGVNIAATPGEAVRAAAAGTVVYAGNSIPAFGNLVLVKHPGGWATLYGNLGRITVSNNAQVSQGQELGTAGVSGAVDRPQVHFEIRYAQDPHDKARPYDPAGLLSAAD